MFVVFVVLEVMVVVEELEFRREESDMDGRGEAIVDIFKLSRLANHIWLLSERN